MKYSYNTTVAGLGENFLPQKLIVVLYCNWYYGHTVCETTNL